ncbi:MAG: hypothetical protein ABR951_10480 [Candidatus Aminicenantales bacterium]|jgi:hypothetical protein
MESAITLYGYLLLTFLGIIIPLLGILLSLFREGIEQLSAQYKNQKSNSDKNLLEQMKKQSESGQANIPEIQESILELKAIKKTADKRLSYLDPKKQLLRLFLFLFIAFLLTLTALLIKDNLLIKGAAVALSLFFFSSTLYILWKSLGILVEVKETIDTHRGERESKVIELLSSSVSGVYLKDIYPQINGKNINNDKTQIDLTLNVKTMLKIAIDNSEKKMAKSVEIGFIFPREFLIEKSDSYSIYTGEDGNQVVRYKTEQIQGITLQLFPALVLNPMKEGDFIVRTFIKAENIEAKYYIVLFKVKK